MCKCQICIRVCNLQAKWETELRHTQVFHDVQTVDVKQTPKRPEDTIRIVFISDTHDYPACGRRINIPDGYIHFIFIKILICTSICIG